MIRLLKHDDSKGWINLAGEVEHLFGPMTLSDEFHQAVRDCIKNGDAFCVEEGGRVIGIVALDRAGNEISWLAVAEGSRGRGYGDQLVRKALDELRSDAPVLVRTFAPGTEAGRGARRIYERNGFVDLKPAGRNPAGYETVIMARKTGIQGPLPRSRNTE